MQAFSLSAKFSRESAMLKLPEEMRKWASQRERGGGGEREKKKRRIFFLPFPSPLSFFRPRTYRKGYYFYSPQSSTVIKSKMAATTILRTRTRFRPPKIRLHCRLQLSRPSCKCCVTQKLSSVLYYKTKNPFEGKICLKISFQLL